MSSLPSISDIDGNDEPFRILDEDGNVTDENSLPALDADELVEMYRLMRLGRRFDEKAVSLQRQGRMGTYPPMSGQEGAQVGSAYALNDDDWLVPSYREHLSMRMRGIPLTDVLRYWGGYEEGNAVAEESNTFPITVPIATQIPHATGLAWASRMRGDNEVVLCYFGDGATSEGDFHEGLNFAGVFDAPAVFFCNNNQWAISVPGERQTASSTLSQKAIAYGFEGVRVDGMDPLATYAVTRAAIEKARQPGSDEARPTLIEAVQYRYGAHTTADDPSVYRDEKEVEQWKAKDPIDRLESYLRCEGVLDEDSIQRVESEIADELDSIVNEFDAGDEADPEKMFANVYKEMTPRLGDQYDALENLRDRYGDDRLTED